MSNSGAAPPLWEGVLTRLVNERGAALIRYAELLCGNRDDAADLVQDALVSTFARLRNGFSIASAEAYVRRGILNQYLDGGRKKTRWRRVQHLEIAPLTAPSAHEPTDDRLDMHAELAKLSPRERSCLVLRYYEDLAVNDIAQWLSISPGAVKRYLSDGLAKLAISLAPALPAAENGDDHANRI